MSPIRVLFSVLAASSLSACGLVEADPHRFERWGQAVAEIPVEDRAAASPSAESLGLRPALQVEVMDVDDFWAARDGALEAGLRGAVEAAAPAVTRAVTEEVGRHLGGAAPAAAEAITETVASTTVQLGAFSSETAARAAWTRLSEAGGPVFEGLAPQFERIEREGRQLVRLRAGPVEPQRAAELCRAAGVADRWCASTGRS